MVDAVSLVLIIRAKADRNSALSHGLKKRRWIPAFAGMTSKENAEELDSRLTSSAVEELLAGMTSKKH